METLLLELCYGLGSNIINLICCIIAILFSKKSKYYHIPIWIGILFMIVSLYGNYLSLGSFDTLTPTIVVMIFVVIITYIMCAKRRKKGIAEESAEDTDNTK